MDDAELHHRINELVEEEHRLERSHAGRRITDAGAGAARRTRRRTGPHVGPPAPPRGPPPAPGQDPDAEQERPADVVEEYRQ